MENIFLENLLKNRQIEKSLPFRADENPLSLNLYTYCANDPIRYTDPSGHVVLKDEATVSAWSSGSSKATFTIGGVKQDLYVEDDGKVFDSMGYEMMS